MKISSGILVASVIANVGLGIAWVSLRAASPMREKAIAASNTAATPKENSAAQTAATWARMDQDDLGTFSERLREAGFSRAEMRAILDWKIAARYPRRTPATAAPYWRSQFAGLNDPNMAEERLQQAIERQDLLRRYLGPSTVDDLEPEALEHGRARFGANLSAEKIHALMRIEEDYQLVAMKQNLEQLRAGGGRSNGIDREAHALLAREKAADIARVLSPEELAEYELRHSPTAQSLRFRLGAFQPNEEEFRAVFAIHRQFAEQLNDAKLSPEELGALRDKVASQVVATLGPERGQDYIESQRGQDQTARLVARLGLPARTNAEIRTLREDLTQRAATVRNDPQLSASDRAAQLRTLADEARAKLAAKLGPQGFEAYYDLKHEWIRALEGPDG